MALTVRMSETQSIPPGWYDDGSGSQRYWDGSTWTEQTQEQTANAPVPSSHPTKEYMVLTQKDRLFGGKFNPVKVQEALNALGNQGWVLAEAVTATFPTLGGGREELVIFLERDRV
jgi:hypothetical protein